MGERVSELRGRQWERDNEPDPLEAEAWAVQDAYETYLEDQYDKWCEQGLREWGSAR